MSEYPRTPARYTERGVVPARHTREAPTQTTIIPAVRKPHRRPGIVPLSDDARKRTLRISGIVVFGVLVGLLLSFTPLFAALTHPELSLSASQRVALIPTATPSRPVVAGEHDFVCAALPFARLAQVEMTSGPRAQPHPWYLSVILAQWGIEQGWTIPGYTGYNWANSSALPGFPAVSGTNQPGSPAAFAYADNAEDGVKIYVAFVQNGLYDGVAAAWAQGPTAQALALGASPWDAAHYTDIGRPGSTILDVLQTYNLKRLDQPGATC